MPSTTGSTLDLAALHGKTVLLYFQEGLTCQPCWDQLKDIQSNMQELHALGINEIVSITSDPLNALQQKVADEGLTIPVLSDQNLAASTAYNANQYGFCQNSEPGRKSSRSVGKNRSKGCEAWGTGTPKEANVVRKWGNLSSLLWSCSEF